MKKLRGIIFWVIFVIYEEIIFSSLIFGKFPKTFFMIALMSCPLAIVLNVLTSLFKEKINIAVACVLSFLVCFIVGAQLIYFKIYEAILSAFSIFNGGQVTEFMTTILEVMGKNWIGLVLIFLPFIALIVNIILKRIDFKKKSIKTNLIKISAIVVANVLGILVISLVSTKGMYSNKNLYYNIHVPKVTVSKMGLYTEMKLDLKRLIFGFEEKLAVETYTLPEEAISEEVTYNVTEINFDELINNESNEKIKTIHEYISKQTPSEQNEYTGMFKGKNLVVFVAEGLSNIAIREDLTPNLYRLYKEGFQFDNFYTPLFPVSTADGEYITDTSLIPKEGVWSIYKVRNNYMPYSYANLFEQLGYSSNSYHDHTATYYDRDQYIKAMGYNSYLAVGTGLEDRMNTKLWPNSDYEMIDVTVDDYINNDKFLAYYMTVSGHLNYTTIGNCMASRNWDLVKDLEYSHRAKAYLSCQIELDKAVGELISELEKAGKLEDTVIVLSPDHYPYGLDLNEINELSTYERDDRFEKHHTPLLIWSASMKEPIKVEKICASLDVLPTVLNLFGIEFDSRLLMGNDILSNNKEQIVIFSDRSFITEKGRYDSLKGKFTPNEGVEVEEDYVERINSIIYQKFKMSAMILDNDYYRVLFGK